MLLTPHRNPNRSLPAMALSPAKRRVFYDCILDTLSLRRAEVASTAPAATRSAAREAALGRPSLSQMLNDPHVRAVFAAIRSRRAGPVIGHLMHRRIYAHITGANGERWEFDGCAYPGRVLSDDDFVASNRAVYVRRA